MLDALFAALTYQLLITDDFEVIDLIKRVQNLFLRYPRLGWGLRCMPERLDSLEEIVAAAPQGIN